MAHYQHMVLEYWQQHAPEHYATLKRQRSVKDELERVVALLYDETERELADLRERFPDQSREELRVYAEEIAIDAILPAPADVTG